MPLLIVNVINETAREGRWWRGGRGDLVKTADETGRERRMSHGHRHLQLLCDFPGRPRLNLVISQVLLLWIEPPVNGSFESKFFRKAFEERPHLVAGLFLVGDTWTHIINTLSGSRLETSICR